METKKDYINRIYNLARMRGLCKTQSEFSELLAMNPSTISKALQGDEKYLTNNLVRRLQIWAKQAGIEAGAPEPAAPAPQPDIIIPAATATLYNNMSETIRIQAELIARLQGSMVAGYSPAHIAPKNYRENE